MLGGKSPEWELSKAWPDIAVELCSISPKRRWREVKPFALFEPLVEKLSYCDTKSIGPRRCLVLDQGPKSIIGTT